MLRRRWAALALAGCLLTNSGCFGLMDRCCHNNAGIGIGNGQLVGRMFGQNQTAVAPAAYAGGMPIHTGMPGGSGDCTCGQGDGLYHPVGMSHGGAPQGFPAMMTPDMGPPSGVPIQTLPVQTLPATTTPQNNPGPRITPVPMSPSGVSPSGFAPPQTWHP